MQQHTRSAICACPGGLGKGGRHLECGGGAVERRRRFGCIGAWTRAESNAAEVCGRLRRIVYTCDVCSPGQPKRRLPAAALQIAPCGWAGKRAGRRDDCE